MINFYLINLDRSPDRLAWMKQRADQLGIKVQRVSAVDGRKLDSEVIERWNRARHPRFGMGPNEIACFLSHRTVWERIVETGDPWAFIAEDDIHIADIGASFLADSSWIPGDADLVKAETVKQRVWLSRRMARQHLEHQLFELRSFHGGSAGYFVSRAGAQKLLDSTEDFCVPLDQVLFNQSFPPAQPLKIYQIVPALVAQDWVVETAANQPKFESLLLNERNAFHGNKQKKHQSFGSLAWYKVANPIRKAYRRGLEAAANLLGTHRVTKVAFDGETTFEVESRSAAA